MNGTRTTGRLIMTYCKQLYALKFECTTDQEG